MSLAVSFGKTLKKRSIVCFFGDLGAGKTTFIKGLVKGFAGINENLVSSPTYVYLNIYQGKEVVYHFDLYRLRDSDEFLSMGFDEMFFSDGICCIEWSERIENLLPPSVIKVTLENRGITNRLIRIEQF